MIGSVLRPGLQHPASVFVALLIPVFWIASQTVWQLLPHECCVESCRRLRWIEPCRAGTPHYGLRNFSPLMAGNDVQKLSRVLKPQDGHERLHSGWGDVPPPDMQAAA